MPYCDVPCYGALFGPQLFGHGSTVESHKSFGQPNLNQSSSNSHHPKDTHKDTPAKLRSHETPKVHKSPQHEQLEAKLKAYNLFFNSKGTAIRSREVNGRLVLEGALRVYWGVQSVIHLKEDDDQRTVVTVRKRNSCRYSEITDEMKEPLLDEHDPMATSVCVSENGFDISDSTTCDSVTWSEDQSNGASNGQRGGEGVTGQHLHDDEDKGESTSQEVSPVHNNNNNNRHHQVNSVSSSSTLPSKLDLKKPVNVNGSAAADAWDELDDLLQVERKVDDNEKLYQTLPTAISKSSSLDISSSVSSTTESSVSNELLEDESSTTTTTNQKDDTISRLISAEEDLSSVTLKPEDFNDFKRRMQKEFFENANEMRSSNDGTLKAGLPIDPSRINDSLKLYSDNNLMSKSFSGAVGANKSYEIGE